MNNVQVIEKPDFISWDSIHEILYKAHESNRKNGVFMRTATLSGEELKNRIGDKGQCFVVLVNGELAGTISVKFILRNTWYHKGRIADMMLAGVLPKYKGCGLYSLLTQECYAYSKKNGIDVIELDTAEGNIKLQSISLKNEFKYVATKASPYTKHYSVVMVKWLGKCPFSTKYINFRYKLQTFLFKLRYKRGSVNRLLIWKKV